MFSSYISKKENKTNNKKKKKEKTQRASRYLDELNIPSYHCSYEEAHFNIAY